jgi:hypothetical protein
MLFLARIRIRIELKCWIRNRIQVNPDPQPCSDPAKVKSVEIDGKNVAKRQRIHHKKLV